MSKSKMRFVNYVDRKEQKVCVMMRGISGSGKSYTAKQVLKQYGEDLIPANHIFGSDDFFISDILKEKQGKRDRGEEIDDEYYAELEPETYKDNWSADKLRTAHMWNFRRFEDALSRDVTPVIIDNTNGQAWGMENYIKTAKKAGYKIYIQEPTSPWWQDHAHMFADKKKYGKQLEDFARFLAGHHHGMADKYGVKGGNQHSVPLHTLRKKIRQWQPNLTPEEVLEKKKR